MKLEVIDPRPFHCGQLARTLRAEHLDLLSDMNVPTHRELRDAFDASVIRRAWLFDGVLGAMAGITGTVASGEGVIWLALTDGATKYPYHIARGAVRFMKEAMMTKRRLSTTVLANDKSGVAFAYFLGFRADKRSTINGASVLLMSYADRKAA